MSRRPKGHIICHSLVHAEQVPIDLEVWRTIVRRHGAHLQLKLQNQKVILSKIPLQQNTSLALYACIPALLACRWLSGKRSRRAVVAVRNHLNDGNAHLCHSLSNSRHQFGQAGISTTIVAVRADTGYELDYQGTRLSIVTKWVPSKKVRQATVADHALV